MSSRDATENHSEYHQPKIVITCWQKKFMVIFTQCFWVSLPQTQSRKAIYFSVRAATSLVLSAAIVSRCVRLCSRPYAPNQNTIFSTKHVSSNPANNQLHMWSDYSGISSSGGNGLDLHTIAKWHRVLNQPIWQLYCFGKMARREASVKSHPVGAL